MPGTLVLNGVRSPRTYASSVTCSVLPPSHAFQLRVSVIRMASASSITRRGVTNFFQLASGWGVLCVLSCSGASFATGVPELAGTGVEDINLLLGSDKFV